MDKTFNFTVNVKVKRSSKKATPDGFNGYGKYRANSLLPYGVLNNLRNKSGIYYLKNNITNLLYIGSSKNIGERISKHFSQLNCGNHPNHKLTLDYNKYGIDSFVFGVLEYADDNLKNLERDYQRKHDINELYNLQIKDTYHSDKQKYGWKHANKSYYKNSEYREKMRNLKKNRIAQFDINGNFIEIFESKEEACLKYNIAHSTILGCCNGSKKTAAGYIWRYVDNNGNIIKEGKGRNRTIIQQNEDIV